ncbi:MULTISPECIES: carboxylate--amine ligase [unclassified Sporosarcina]|uniref:carboxylate--amine ligase n=1 Tax=unclassified Sporosarcina TaxID=2647733 RepID=UPI000C165642|nr:MULTISPECIES: carboxylate--amine ligase [unclassified Sporosarcina]PIC85530.1 carboxylate--amine ligase [Sporosarcina sp. P20a]PIC98410.1 carboxylate--amine ligase [Sporosarcina sp. P29]PID04763.1 carboxylate--amine ligase [Sporosarcina sp. P30]PID07917.1 carboxylate--amine ligase [Sporosarcina sp. P31]PID11103.1 carboxylate--amine ligase [Sporosarcina sp. P32b]
MSKHSFIPIIVGTNINAYNMAISFHEEYGIKPVIVGREPLPFTSYSTITDIQELNPGLHDPEIFVQFLREIAKKYRTADQKLVLVGTDDLYVRLIIEQREALQEDFLFNYINEEIMNAVYIKKNFYELCAEHGIDTPSTYFHSCLSDEPFTEEVLFPVIIKPSDGVQYYRHPFEGLQKIYKVDTYEEINRIIQMVKASGYTEDLIIQDFIPGDDTYMWDAVYYADQHGKAQLITLAQVVLQERAMTAIGNYTALITRYDKEIMTKLANFLEAIGYVGYGNFDLKYDERDGKFKAFEVNIRQGRSSYYITQCGENMAKYLVDDLVYGKEKPLTYLDDHFLFTVVPKAVLKKFVDNPPMEKEIRSLIKAGKYGNPLFYNKDKHMKRKLYLLMRQINYYKKYKNAVEE